MEKENSFMQRVYDSLAQETISYYHDKVRANNPELPGIYRSEAAQRAEQTFGEMSEKTKEETVVFEHVANLHLIRHTRF